MVYVLLIAVFIIVIIIKDSAKAEKKKEAEKAAAAQREAAEAKRRAAEEERRAWEARRKAELEEWERQHGRFTTAIAGVTFDNEDGTSRQKILKDLKIRGTAGANLRLEEFEYKGSPAVRVIVDDMCIGNIPKNRVEELFDIMEKLEKANLEIDTFYPEEEKRRRRGNRSSRSVRLSRRHLSYLL